MKIKYKLFILSFIYSLGLSILLFFIFNHSRKLEERVTFLTNAQELNGLAQDIIWLDEVLTQSTRNYIFTQEEVWRNRYDLHGAILDNKIKRAKSLAIGSFEIDLFNRQDKANLKLVDIELQAHSLVSKGNSQKALELINSKNYLEWKQIYKETIESYLNFARDNLSKHSNNHNQEVASFTQGVLLTIFISSIASMIFFVIFARHLLKSLYKLKSAVESVAQGNYNTKINIDSNDELHDIAESFNIMSAKTYHLIEDVKKANVAKDLFLANISHEIRTPLNGIVGIIDVLKETELTPEQMDLINTVDFSGEHLLEVVSDVLDFSKINQGKMIIEEVDFDLNIMIKECVELMRIRAAKKGVRLKYSGTGITNLKGDVTKLKQIFMNLMSNAIKFTESGVIEVIFDVKTVDNGHQCFFSVKDTGVGMTPEQMKKVFSPFTQADLSTTRKFGGTGLGLAISLELVKMLDGDITCESQIGEGTCFHFNVFLRPSTLENKMTSNQLEFVEFSQIKILLVEDNKINQKVASLMLDKLGILYEIANNGLEAIDIVSQDVNAFDFILMDLQMPVMGGIEATEKLIARYSDKTPRIIAMTANAFVDDRRKCYDVGMIDFISKPVKKSDLVRTLKQNILKKAA